MFRWVYEYVEYLHFDPQLQEELKMAVKVHLYDLASLEVEHCKRSVEPARKKTAEAITK